VSQASEANLIEFKPRHAKEIAKCFKIEMRKTLEVSWRVANECFLCD
jgi:hypothetical protein